MTQALPAPRTAQALQARQQRTEASLRRIADAVAHLEKTRTPITVSAVARHADVSRTFLYEHAQARTLVEEATRRASGRRIQDRQDELAELEAAWRERALNAEDALKATQDEVLNQRAQIAELLGQIRDLQTEWSEDDIVRITTENSTLKKRVRELEQENRRVIDRLAAARDNVRFADKRIADLEAHLLEGGQPSPRGTP
jgi:chromosome segregation ATPase